MTLQLSSGNSISLTNIQGEFGGINPISISEYYAGAATGYVPAGTTGSIQITQNQSVVTAIPNSGAIKFSNFYASQRAFTYAVTMTSGTYVNTNLRTMAVAAGWNQVVPVTINCTINAGAIMTGSDTGNYGIYAYGTWPAGSVLNLTNNGTIVGKGGRGGAGYRYYLAYGTWVGGEAGGPAMIFNLTTNIVNNGIIGGGGGGGGGGYQGDLPWGGGGGGGGAGSGAGGSTISTYTYETQDGEGNSTGSASIDSGCRDGSAGGVTTAGAGGSGGSAYGYGNNRWGYGGGAGGGLGSAGGYYYSSFDGSISSYAAGAGGVRWYGNQYLGTYTNNGSVYGNVANV
jgi:hypothetical protein